MSAIDQVLAVSKRYFSQPIGEEKCDTYKEELSQKILYILHSDFHNPNIPMTLSSINSICISEVENIYKLLVDGIVSINKPLLNVKKTRPKCPVISPKHHSMARYDYKQDMVNYISRFNFILKDYVCNYNAAFLEALANYCEHIVNEELELEKS